MYRQLEECPAGQSSTGRPAGATTNEWPSKGKSRPGSLNRSGGDNHRLSFAWEASDKCGSSETPLRTEWRFLRLGRSSPAASVFFGSPRSAASNTLPPKGHLPQANLRCSIRVAYQAADAGHPDMGRASSPRSKEISPASSVLTSLCAAIAHIGQGIT